MRTNLFRTADLSQRTVIFHLFADIFPPYLLLVINPRTGLYLSVHIAYPWRVLQVYGTYSLI